MAIDSSQLIARLRGLAPFETDDAARRACEATLGALRRGLEDDDADWLALDLGPQLAAPLVRATHAGELSLEQFYQRVARLAGTRRGIAREQAQVVCRALGELLAPATTARLRRCLPQLAPLFAPPAPEAAPTGPYHVRDEPPADHTLAGGRAGATRPLHDARPSSAAELPAQAPARGHTHSVAVSGDPHAGSTLSSARGLSQEQDSRTLARWRGGAHG